MYRRFILVIRLILFAGGVTLSCFSYAQELINDFVQCGDDYHKRRYSSFLSCSDGLEKKLSLKNTEGSGEYQRFLSASIALYKSEVLLELGRLEESLQMARLAHSLVPDLKQVAAGFAPHKTSGKLLSSLDELNAYANFLKKVTRVCDCDQTWVASSPIDGNAQVLGNLARLEHLSGNARRAAYYADELALLGAAGLREKYYFFYLNGHYDKVVKQRELLEERLKSSRNEALLSMVTGVTVAIASAVINKRMITGDLGINQWTSLISNSSGELNKLSNFRESVRAYAGEFMYAKSLVESGEFNRAYDLLKILAELEGSSNFGNLYWAVNFELGKMAMKIKGPTEAQRYYEIAIDAIESVRATIHFEASKIGFVADKQIVYQEMIKILADSGNWHGVFDYVERAKSRALVDLLSQQDRFKSEQGEFAEVIKLLSSEPGFLAEEYKDYSVKTRGLNSDAKRDFAHRSPELASLVSVRNAPLQVIRDKLRADEHLVNYYFSSDIIYAIVVGSSTLTGFKIEANGLEKDIRDFRELIQHSDSSTNDLGKRLYSRLLAELAFELKGKSITISPHGPLHYLPFAALNDGKRFLVDRFSIRMTPSANALAYVKIGRPEKMGRLLALGNPDLLDKKLDLPAAEEEAKQVATLFPDSKALLRKDATKDAVKKFGRGFSIIHIASHGEFDSKKPLNSGLLLAASSSGHGRLTVSDLYELDLDSDLVTLSACETGLGKVASGDDVVGLTRGFLYAGARSIVASLWQVDDAATAQLMTSFYRKIASNIDQREALRLAQIETKKHFPHPFYWGAFQITGAAN